MTRSLSRFVAVAAVLASSRGLAQQTFKVDKYNIGGDGAFDYVYAEPGTGRVFVSRSTHAMVVEGATGKVLHDFTGLRGVHGFALAPKENHGFITGSGDSVVTMFDLKTYAVVRSIQTHTGGLDGIMYDDFSNRIILTNHSRPKGTATAIDAKTGDIVGVADLEDTAPEGAASDGKGKIFVNNEGTNTIQVLDVKAMKVLASWPIAPCEGPTGIAYDRATDRIFSACSGTSVVVNALTGKVVATIKNGNGADALGWDASTKLIYIPAGQSANVTVVHQDAADTYTVVGTVATMAGARTLGMDPVSHTAYVFTPEYGPAPAPAAGDTGRGAGAGGRAAGGRGGRGRGPMVGAWLIAIRR